MLDAECRMRDAGRRASGLHGGVTRNGQHEAAAQRRTAANESIIAQEGAISQVYDGGILLSFVLYYYYRIGLERR